jgi:predicted transposase/invertase (TIGR01784 family)
MTDIDKINDKIFKKMLENDKNAGDVLKKILPQVIKSRLDFSTIKVDTTNYVSNEFKEGYSDVVVTAEMKSREGGKIPTDIYFILEHKTEGKVEVFIQVLKYMCFVWEKDVNEKRPPRIIIPIIFYHGEKDWSVPGSFIELFDVDDEIKEFLLDFRYVLFDTNPWDFRDENNEELKKNVYAFTSMVLMKLAYHEDWDAVAEIFKFWQNKGFVDKNKSFVLFFMAYISNTQGINRDKLTKMLDDNKIDGGEIMQTLAQQMKEEFKEEFMETLGPQLKEEGIEVGKEAKARETARELIKRGVDMDIIEGATGISRDELEKMAATVQ